MARTGGSGISVGGGMSRCRGGTDRYSEERLGARATRTDRRVEFGVYRRKVPGIATCESHGSVRVHGTNRCSVDPRGCGIARVMVLEPGAEGRHMNTEHGPMQRTGPRSYNRTTTVHPHSFREGKWL